ncbi:hypothetical protein DPEC_G00099750 [Dallia pectoralis]|uniref:Uncharacterized protein n=1 Tax=Dallia pectoralis TaxID=75939 RepID=A0ACC2GXA6_DALPE|nr:hypothetical protein DPEC_G00099750 [Dallia pectoralis]
MWTDEFNKRSYTAFTGHFINDDRKLESRVISTAEFDSTLKKTADNIHEQIIKELHDFAEERNAVYDQARRLVREFDSAPRTPQASLREPSREPDPNQPMPRVDDEAERVKRKKEMLSVSGRMKVKLPPRKTRFSATLRDSSFGTKRTFYNSCSPSKVNLLSCAFQAVKNDTLYPGHKRIKRAHIQLCWLGARV